MTKPPRRVGARDRGGALHQDGVQFAAEDEDNAADVEKQERDDDAAQTAVRQAVICEIAEIEGQQAGG